MKEQVVSDPALERELIKKNVPSADEAQTEKLVRFYELLIERNNVMNLTAITDAEGVATRHFADSLISLDLIPEGARVIDVGTGAGFPGIPLAIMRPDISLVLLDSLNKRIQFLNDILKELDLNAQAVHSRAEDAARKQELREGFDAVVSRAVAELPVLAEWTLPFAKVGGVCVMYKGPGAAEELKNAANALKVLHGRAKLMPIAAEWGERNLVVIEKTAATPAKYPRKAGTAAKSPL